MLENDVLDLLNKKWVQLSIALFLGVTIGAIFYPTKSIEERVKKETSERYELKIEEVKREYDTQVITLKESLDQEQAESLKHREETRERIFSLTTENRELRQSMKKRKFKVVKPDGTVIEKEYEESQSEEVTSVVTEIRQEFDRKVQTIEDKWKKLHKQRVEDIRKQHLVELEKVKSEVKEKTVYVEKEKIVKVNEKRFRPEIGVTSDKDAYFHITYSLWGPVFIGAGGEGSVENKQLGEGRIGIGVEL